MSKQQINAALNVAAETGGVSSEIAPRKHRTRIPGKHYAKQFKMPFWPKAKKGTP